MCINKKIITLLFLIVFIIAVLSCDNPKTPFSPKKVLSSSKVGLEEPKTPLKLLRVSPDDFTIQGLRASIPEFTKELFREKLKEGQDYDMTVFKGIIIPDTVIKIGDNVFARGKLEKISIPDSVETIGKSAFFENELTSVTIGSSVKTIGRESFAYNRLTSVTIPESVEDIAVFAFVENKPLTKVIISKKLYDKYSAEDLKDRFGLRSADGIVSNPKVTYYLLTNQKQEHVLKPKKPK